ncbi:MAG: energy-coupling factor transporter transmembrane protein EcfT [Desulfurococcaceae archaeon]|jgi:energy-coupling factor transport system permease protein|nr:energy-coupling factor transporter transmembrane protein EcfT [Desulfurococcaceae archaeon]
MRARYRESTLFLYALGASLLAFVANSVKSLILPSLINGILGFASGSKKIPQKLLAALLVLNAWGAFINGLYFHNVGDEIVSIQAVTIRSGAVESFLILTLRFFLIVGSTLLMLGLVNVRDLIRSLERDLRVPSGIAFSIAYAFRLFPLLSKDLSEIRIARKERGFTSVVLSPKHLRSILLPMLNISYERAVWGGISAELRGLRLRKVSGRKPLGLGDVIILSALALQWVISLYS